MMILTKPTGDVNTFFGIFWDFLGFFGIFKGLLLFFGIELRFHSWIDRQKVIQVFYL